MQRLALSMLFLALAGCPRSAKTGTTTKLVVGEPSGGDATDVGACCEQCLGAAGRDPTAMDLGAKECTSYPPEWNGPLPKAGRQRSGHSAGEGVAAECVAAMGMTVGEWAPAEGRAPAQRIQCRGLLGE